MPHQESLTIQAEISAARFLELDEMLSEIGRKRTMHDLIPFPDLGGVHFARILLMPQALDIHGQTISASILYLCEVDAPARAHIAELVDKATAGLDRLFAGCDGYRVDSAADRIAWLHAHTLPTAAYYVNTVGRGLTQIQQEALLREAIEDFLDRDRPRLALMPALDIRAAVQEHVKTRPDLSFAQSPPDGPSLGWRLGEALHQVGVPALTLALAPLAAAAAPLWAALLRWYETHDVPHQQRPDPQSLRELSRGEDFAAQSPLTAIGFVKPGWFRQVTLTGALAALDYGVRHLYNRGSLTGVRTIHFARWLLLDDGRRALFASNYDGSLESYMDEFIDKVAWGLNAVFSNGLGYPRTRWLVGDGATDEQAFKNYLRTHQLRTHVWYSAYENLTTHNIETNARIRAGLLGQSSPAEAQAWLALL
ncbi:hypothetical protein CS0771_55100 [Catellatospora sp. IY07-71]|uniref:hypothetical protein n=1 Tax=Catellatospora sp. IY07-71 TaxID=2728827 RepID=UPI001BB394CD|nr:hypothetical protein [Catellatospora sp. IY07-71]BCJ75966.1 hypothetical protein CS0771_55100 [Catellatospora sp. IY07-71]